MDETDVSEFILDVSLVDAGPVAAGYATSTDDNCGSGNTGSSACHDQMRRRLLAGRL